MASFTAVVQDKRYGVDLLPTPHDHPILHYNVFHPDEDVHIKPAKGWPVVLSMRNAAWVVGRTMTVIDESGDVDKTSPLALELLQAGIAVIHVGLPIARGGATGNNIDDLGVFDPWGTPAKYGDPYAGNGCFLPDPALSFLLADPPENYTAPVGACGDSIHPWNCDAWSMPEKCAVWATQHIRANAGALGIDPDRIGVTGGSSGADTAMWVAFRAEQADPTASDFRTYSSRVSCIGITSPQASYAVYTDGQADNHIAKDETGPGWPYDTPATLNSDSDAAMKTYGAVLQYGFNDAVGGTGNSALNKSVPMWVGLTSAMNANMAALGASKYVSPYPTGVETVAHSAWNGYVLKAVSPTNTRLVTGLQGIEDSTAPYPEDAQIYDGNAFRADMVSFFVANLAVTTRLPASYAPYAATSAREYDDVAPNSTNGFPLGLTISGPGFISGNRSRRSGVWVYNAETMATPPSLVVAVTADGGGVIIPAPLSTPGMILNSLFIPGTSAIYLHSDDATKTCKYYALEY